MYVYYFGLGYIVSRRVKILKEWAQQGLHVEETPRLDLKIRAVRAELKGFLCKSTSYIQEGALHSVLVLIISSNCNRS